VSSEGADLELELAYCRPVEVNQLLAPLNVTLLQVTERVPVEDLVDHGVEVLPRCLDLGVDLAVKLAALLIEGDAGASEEPHALAETVESAFRHAR